MSISPVQRESYDVIVVGARSEDEGPGARPSTKKVPSKRGPNDQMEREMRFELTTSTLAIFAQPPTPFGKFNNINHIVSRGVACRPEVSRAKWKVRWKKSGT